jgi:hypothetical protein
MLQTTLTVLDMSAAFDTINYTILVDDLSLWHGMTGIGLSWYKSYPRHKRVKVVCNVSVYTTSQLPKSLYTGTCVWNDIAIRGIISHRNIIEI